MFRVKRVEATLHSASPFSLQSFHENISFLYIKIIGFAFIPLKKLQVLVFLVTWKTQIDSRDFIWLFSGFVVDEEPLYQFDKSRI
jgi:hypothetical protein